MGVELPLPRMAVALGVAPRQQREDEPTLQEHWDGTAGPSQEGQSSQAVGAQGSWSQDRKSRSKAKPSAIRQDKELEADYQSEDDTGQGSTPPDLPPGQEMSAWSRRQVRKTTAVKSRTKLPSDSKSLHDGS